MIYYIDHYQMTCKETRSEHGVFGRASFDYYNFRRKKVTDKINEEIEYYENTTYAKVQPLSEYLVYLRNRIGMDRVEQTCVAHYYDHSGNKMEIQKMNMDEYAKDMDIMMFRKPWNKLKEFHKIMKIKEYINNLEYGTKAKTKNIIANKEHLKTELCNGLKAKKFGKNKAEIIYDQENMNILSIDCLVFQKKTGLYQIEWD